MGKHELRLLKFALRHALNENCHPYGQDQSTRRALQSLERKGLIHVNLETKQFALAIGDNGWLANG